MGGFGSGRQSGLPATSEAKRVDIRYLRKMGLMYSGRWGSLSWTRGGEPGGNVTYRIKGSTFTLDYKVREYGDEWEPVVLDVPLLTTPCRYGGHRYYFQCPNQNCRRRCEVLYSAGKYFLCRKCCGYLYSSQVSDPLDRLREAKDKIGKRIFEDYDGEWGWRKKKWLHQKTFDREYARFQVLDERWNNQFIAMSKALIGSIGSRAI
jgi:hypothetical protein